MNSKEVDTLIDLVRTNSALYDRAHILHNNQNHIKEVWNQIAEELDQPVKKIRDKWKNLRDSYRSQLYRKQEALERGEIAAGELGWPYFQQMSFLEDHMQGRKSLSNSSFRSLKREHEGDDSYSENAVVKIRSGTPLNRIEMVTVDDFDASVLDHLNYQEAGTTQRRNEIEVGCSRDQEEDKCFFESLLPYMKRLSPREKMLCRMKIQEVIFSIAFPKNETETEVIC